MKFDLKNTKVTEKARINNADKTKFEGDRQASYP